MKKTALWKSIIPLLLLLTLLWNADVNAASSGLNVETHTQEEIRQKYKELGIDADLKPGYEVKPVLTAPYNAGKLDQATVDNALNTLNFVRYVAGISYDVQNDSTYQEMVQAATLVNCVNDELSHYPKQPADMDTDLYKLGYNGAGSANIGWTSWSPNDLYFSIVDGWMADEDEFNIKCLGHRRWCLNPTMGKTGFGVVEKYSAMYSIDMSKQSSAYGIVWPAQNTPLDIFSNTELPWNISMGKSINTSSVKVTMERQRDNKTWSFSQNASDGYFNVNNDNYGLKGCIIFRPDEVGAYMEDDSFHVDITGSYSSGTSFSVSYDVNFFPLQAHEHIGGEATCTQKAVCSICGKEYGELAPHQYEVSTEKEPTCTEDGYKKLKCAGCGETKTEVIPATGHQWEEEYTVDEEATCLKEGSQSIHCSVCGAIDEESVAIIPMSDHNWKIEELKESTCTEDGYKISKCIYCGLKQNEELFATGHQWEEEYTVDEEATCLKEGSQSIHCSVCDEKKPGSIESIPMTTHVWETEARVDEAAGCMDPGSKSIHCSICGMKDETTVEEIPAKGHQWGNEQVTKNATCTEKGYKSQTCSQCKTTKAIVIPALGHQWETEATVDVAATCTENGSMCIHCTVCREKKSGTATVISATGHKWKEERIAEEPTCTQDGKKVKECSQCTETITTRIPALGHQWETEATVDVAATCTEDGIKCIHCAVCREKKPDTDIVIPATGHKWGNWIVIQKPTYYEEGIEQRKCEYCGLTEAASIARRQIQEVDAPKLTSVKPTAYNTITVKWTPVQQASGYIIYRKKAGGKWGIIGKVSAGKTQYQDKKVLTGVSYSYKIKAYDEDFQSGYSVELSAKTKLDKPKKLKVKRASSKSIKVTWKKVPGANKYKVYCQKDKKGKYKLTGTVVKPTFLHKKCKKGTIYSYKIVAIRKSGGKTVKSSSSAAKKIKY